MGLRAGIGGGALFAAAAAPAPVAAADPALYGGGGWTAASPPSFCADPGGGGGGAFLNALGVRVIPILGVFEAVDAPRLSVDEGCTPPGEREPPGDSVFCR